MGTKQVARKKSSSKTPAAIRTLEKLTGGALTFGRALEAVRKCEALTQASCADRLGVSKSHLCDVEKGRKTVSVERAAAWARLLGYPEATFVRLAVQGELDAAGLRYSVQIQWVS